VLGRESFCTRWSSMGRSVKLIRGLWELPLSQGLGGVIKTADERVGGQINCSDPCHDVALSLKQERKVLLE
jgi:hypothetical protein